MKTKLLLSLALVALACIVKAQKVSCKFIRPTTTSFINSDTLKFRYVAYPSKWQPQRFIFYNSGEILTVSAPDSTGMYTVKFAKGKVKFINDSTFTFKMNKMKKTILTAATLIACSLGAIAQTTTIDSNELKTISRNTTIIQQQLHTLHIDAFLRDRLDSVYNQTSAILMEKWRIIKVEADRKKGVKK